MRRGGIAEKTIKIAGGANRSATLAATADAVHFLNEAYKRCKPIAADDNAARLLAATYLYNKLPDANTEAARL